MTSTTARADRLASMAQKAFSPRVRSGFEHMVESLHVVGPPGRETNADKGDCVGFGCEQTKFATGLVGCAELRAEGS